MTQTYTVTTPHQQIQLSESGRYVVKLTKPGAEVEINSRNLVQGQDQLQIELIIHHQAPHTRAMTTLKAVGQDQAQISLKGKIIIDEKCGDTNSFLTERILLLSDQARAETVPDLEISSDDVKCSHAASVSHVPEEQIFYLQSRGLSLSTAQKLIVSGFLA